ncbi:hypothetical protein SAMN04488137_4047 [Fictibacillus solisalsi]|uniref:Uncharacterized protein n=1 Tax=Fictibacillus solisalsi TaxID=459525 RepID=A0A1H0ACN1_9BACL|nr:hypothetical protein [Fictibacillus solisalsi]SDN31235.1 hypothetical protein SAMN04488137_4047 [Fictibacillus solisalsi]
MADYSQVVEKYFFIIRKKHLQGGLNIREYNKKVELINLWFIRHTLRSGLTKKEVQ